MPHAAKLKRPGALKERPVIIITAFGTTRRGRIAYDRFDERVRAAYPDHDIRWAYTSAIVRRKTGTPGLAEQLAAAAAEGYARAVVLPLLIFPGTEYQLMVDACSNFFGMRVVVGETLLHRWGHIDDLLDVMEHDFLPEGSGITVVAAHGTSLAADAATGVYLGMEHIVTGRYPGVYFCSVEGVPDRTAVLNRIRREAPDGTGKQARMLPLMFVAGMHVEDDLLGESDSIGAELAAMGYAPEVPRADVDGEDFLRGLGLTDGVPDMFIARLQRAMMLMMHT